jgi:hypothetical protein
MLNLAEHQYAYPDTSWDWIELPLQERHKSDAVPTVRLTEQELSEPPFKMPWEIAAAQVAEQRAVLRLLTLLDAYATANLRCTIPSTPTPT